MKIYTKGGDKGETSLLGGQRVGKDHARVRAYGELDELNAALGLALALIAAEPALKGHAAAPILGRVQDDLFELGAELADPKGAPRLAPARVEALEAEIDAMTDGLEPLRNFIRPGGSPAGAAVHLARCVCRRAEREAVALAQGQSVGEAALRYLNRLSDHLFTLARELNRAAGAPETPWKSR